MTNRHAIIAALSLFMIFHALVVGRHLESPFFLAAFGWAWVAWAALRKDIGSAKTMSQTMLVMSLLALPPLLSSAERISGNFALLSLALVPSIVSWSCMLAFIAHVTREPEEGVGEIRKEVKRAFDEIMLKTRHGASHTDGGRDHKAGSRAPLVGGELPPERLREIMGSAANPKQRRRAA